MPGVVVLNPTTTLVDLDGNPVPIGVPIPTDLNKVVTALLKDGANDNLAVDGSGTPVEFEVLADPTDNLQLNQIQFVIVDNAIKVDGTQFINVNELANGMKIEIRSNSSTVELVNLKLTEDFLRIASPGGIILDRSSTRDMLVINIGLGGAVSLINGSGDFVRVTVRDDLSQSHFKYFKVTLKATKVTP